MKKLTSLLNRVRVWYNPRMDNKTCFKCIITKPLTDFYKHPQMPDGRVGKCKECNKKDVQKNYAKRREQYALYDKKRSQTPERKAKILVYQRTMRAKCPEKYLARQHTSRAVVRGLLSKLPCEVCGNKKVEAHHTDYTKPLDVVWLCTQHHKEIEGKVAVLSLNKDL